MKITRIIKMGVVVVAVSLCVTAGAARVDVYPQSFEASGWGLDAQFMDVMGSPYLIAHGLGVRVLDAKARVRSRRRESTACGFGRATGRTVIPDDSASSLTASRSQRNLVRVPAHGRGRMAAWFRSVERKQPSRSKT